MRLVVLFTLLSVGLACRKQDPEPDARDAGAAPSTLIDCAGKQVDKATDPANCGACGVVCANPHGRSACTRGVCAPTCDPGWKDCGDPRAGCTQDIKSDPFSCGECFKRCEGVPCVNGVCAGDTRIVAGDLWGSRVVAVDATYAYLSRPETKPKWLRVRMSDGVAEERDGAKEFLPAAFDGKYLYGCKFAPDYLCELRRRENDGPETTIAKLGEMLDPAIVVRDGTLYWVRKVPNSFKDGYGPLADIVALDLKTKTEKVIVSGEEEPRSITADADALYWVTAVPNAKTPGVRKVARAGGTVSTLATIAAANGIALRGTTLFVAAADGIHKTATTGGQLQHVLIGGPAGISTVPMPAARGVVVSDANVLWGTWGKDNAFTLVRASLP